MNISSLVIGLTIVSFGTSLPELLVNLYSSFNGNSDIGVGNILGSNIANILLILGVSAIIFPMAITKNTYFIEVPFSLTATLLVGFLANTELDPNSTGHTISRIDGLFLLFFFALFMAYVYVASKEKSEDDFEKDEKGELMSKRKSFIYILTGIVGLYFGGDWVVTGAVKIATDFGLTKAFVGLTVVAVGTSLPELVTSAVAALKKNSDIAVGNVVGSNIFNLLWILGLSAVLKPIEYHEVSNSDIYMIIISSTLLILGIVVGKRAQISRWKGVIFFIVYLIYMYTLIKGEGLI